MTARRAAAILILGGTLSWAHRLDEYLQATILSVDKNQLRAQMTLTPGVAVFPLVMADLDADQNGVISDIEQRAYAQRVLRDLSLTIDGRRVTPRLDSIRFPTVEAMKEGRGEIQLDFSADLPRGSGNRRLILDNHHQSRIAAYQVNCLVPSDPGLRIVAQNRNYWQSHYELDYIETGVRSDSALWKWRAGDGGWLGGVALLLLARFAMAWRQRGRAATVTAGWHRASTDGTLSSGPAAARPGGAGVAGDQLM